MKIPKLSQWRALSPTRKGLILGAIIAFLITGGCELLMKYSEYRNTPWWRSFDYVGFIYLRLPLLIPTLLLDRMAQALFGRELMSKIASYAAYECLLLAVNATIGALVGLVVANFIDAFRSKRE